MFCGGGVGQEGLCPCLNRFACLDSFVRKVGAAADLCGLINATMIQFYQMIIHAMWTQDIVSVEAAMITQEHAQSRCHLQSHPPPQSGETHQPQQADEHLYPGADV